VAVVLAATVPIAGLALFFFRPSQAIVETFRASVRAEGGALHVGQIERELFADVLRDVRLELGDGATVEAPEVRVSRRPLGRASVRASRARVTLRRDPPSSFSSVRRLAPALAAIETDRVTVDYRDRSLGHLILDGVSRVGGDEQRSFSAESLLWGGVTWPDAIFALAMPRRVLEVSFGSGASSTPRATAKFIPSEGRAAEWMIDVPHQSLAALRRSLGLGASSAEDASRIAGTLSWVTPDDPALPSRGTFHFVLDRWYAPRWPEASALTGSSGSVAAGILPALDGARFRLVRVEIAAGPFALAGSGSVSSGEQPVIRLESRGRRTCAELSEHLPRSRYRDAVRAKLGLERESAPVTKSASSARSVAASESVELSVTIELSVSGAKARKDPRASGSGGHLRFHWHLSPGCGLEELDSVVDGMN
jgi:hypothetical protein